MTLPPLTAGSPLARALFRLLDGDPVVAMPAGSTFDDLAELLVRAESVQPDANVLPVLFTPTEQAALRTAAWLQRAFAGVAAAEVVVHPTTDSRQFRLMRSLNRNGQLGGALQLPLLVAAVGGHGEAAVDLAIVEPSLGRGSRLRLRGTTNAQQVLVTGPVPDGVLADYVHTRESDSDRYWRRQCWGEMPIEAVLAGAQ